MNPKSILGRYLIKQIIVNFITVLMMVLGVVLLFEVVELLRRTSGRDDVDFAFVMEMAVTKLPKTVEMVFPFVVMIAAMVTFWKLSKSNEFVIVRAAGVSIWGFLAPVLFATFAIGVINVTVVNPISANMYDLYETLEYRLKTKNPKAVLFSDQGLWIREAIDKDNVMVLQAKSVRQEKADLFLRDITILEMDRRSQPSRRLEAFAGTLKDGFFELKDVRVFIAGEPFQEKSSLQYKTTLTPEILLLRNRFLFGICRIPSVFMKCRGFRRNGTGCGICRCWFLRFCSVPWCWWRRFLRFAPIIAAAALCF